MYCGPQLAAAGLDFLDLDDIGVGVELHVVEQAHRRHHEAHLHRQRPAQRLDLLGEPVAAVGRIDQRQQRIAELDLEIVHPQRGSDRLVGGFGLGFGFRFLLFGRDGQLVALVDDEGERAGAAAEHQERQHRNAGQQRHHQHHRARHAERLGIAGQLLEQRLVGGAGNAGFRHQQASRSGDDQCRDLRDQAVTDGEEGVGMRGVGKTHALLRDADDHAADDVDEHHQEAGDGVAAHEFGGAVHGAEKAAFVLELLAAAARFFLVDQPGGEIGVDRHLLAGHGVQVKARSDFGDSARAFRDHHEIDDHQDDEDDDADDEIAAHHEIAEGLDDIAGGVCAFMAARQDEPRGGEVERQPQHGRDQQHSRERGEFERCMDEQRRHQDQHREDDRDRQREIEQQRRQRQDQHHQDGEHADGESDVAAPDEGADLAEAGQSDGARCGGGAGGGGGVAHA